MQSFIQKSVSVFGLTMLLGNYYRWFGMLCAYGGNLTIKNRSNPWKIENMLYLHTSV